MIHWKVPLKIKAAPSQVLLSLQSRHSNQIQRRRNYLLRWQDRLPQPTVCYDFKTPIANTCLLNDMIRVSSIRESERNFRFHIINFRSFQTSVVLNRKYRVAKNWRPSRKCRFIKERAVHITIGIHVVYKTGVEMEPRSPIVSGLSYGCCQLVASSVPLTYQGSCHLCKKIKTVPFHSYISKATVCDVIYSYCCVNDIHSNFILK